jgi:hypothetical protein
MNVSYGCIDTFTVEVHDLHPVLEISNFLHTKFKEKWILQQKQIAHDLD